MSDWASDDELGWASPANARLYGAFADSFDMYQLSTRQLVRAARLQKDTCVVDLCCGTGASTAVILQSLGERATVIAVDGSNAMLSEARSRVRDRRVTWVQSRAEKVDELGVIADAVICNAAIWQAGVEDLIPAVARVLRPSGRFAFNIPSDFLSLRVADEPAPAQRRSLLDYMMAIAVADYGFVPSRRGSRTRPLTPGRIERLLLEAGFGTPDLTTHSTITDLTAQAAWLSIPVFTETRLAGMSYAERMSVLSKALQKFESVGSRSEEWHVFVATLGA